MEIWYIFVKYFVKYLPEIFCAILCHLFCIIFRETFCDVLSCIISRVLFFEYFTYLTSECFNNSTYITILYILFHSTTLQMHRGGYSGYRDRHCRGSGIGLLSLACTTMWLVPSAKWGLWGVQFFAYFAYKFFAYIFCIFLHILKNNS